MGVLSRLSRFTPKSTSNIMRSYHQPRTPSHASAKPRSIPLPPPPTKPIISRLPTHRLGKVTLSGTWTLFFAEALAVAAGIFMLAKTDVLSISKTCNGVAWFEKNKERLAVTGAGKTIVVEKEDGKWRARAERQERK